MIVEISKILLTQLVCTFFFSCFIAIGIWLINFGVKQRESFAIVMGSGIIISCIFILLIIFGILIIKIN